MKNEIRHSAAQEPVIDGAHGHLASVRVTTRDQQRRVNRSGL